MFIKATVSCKGAIGSQITMGAIGSQITMGTNGHTHVLLEC
jgi:hypothetical protein